MSQNTRADEAGLLPRHSDFDWVAVETAARSFKVVARSFKVVPITAPVHSDVEIETAIMDLGSEPGGGLVVTPDPSAHQVPIISAAARNNVPAIYWQSALARDGGLPSYGGHQDRAACCSCG
jgi:hypothetical protein